MQFFYEGSGSGRFCLVSSIWFWSISVSSVLILVYLLFPSGSLFGQFTWVAASSLILFDRFSDPPLRPFLPLIILQKTPSWPSATARTSELESRVKQGGQSLVKKEDPAQPQSSISRGPRQPPGAPASPRRQSPTRWGLRYLPRWANDRSILLGTAFCHSPNISIGTAHISDYSLLIGRLITKLILIMTRPVRSDPSLSLSLPVSP